MKRTIMGIDPGTQMMGFSLLMIENNEPKVVLMDVLSLAHHADIYVRLGKIYKKVNELALYYKPETLAIEAPFYGKNIQSMLKLGRAQGVAIAAAMQTGLSVTEYSPKKIKQSITGNGNADKEQVWKMLKQLLSLEEQPKYFDATDALAVALCHHYQSSSPIVGNAKPVKGWGDFIAQNPDRIL